MKRSFFLILLFFASSGIVSLGYLEMAMSATLNKTLPVPKKTKKTTATQVKTNPKKAPASVKEMSVKLKKAKPVKTVQHNKKSKSNQKAVKAVRPISKPNIVTKTVSLPAKPIVSTQAPAPVVAPVPLNQLLSNGIFSITSSRLNSADIYKKNAPSIVKVVTSHDPQSQSFSEGSGFFISPYVVATHIKNVSAIFSGDSKRQVFIQFQNKLYRATILQLDVLNETALLRPEINSTAFIDRKDYQKFSENVAFSPWNSRRLVLGFTNPFLVQMKESEYAPMQLGGPIFNPQGELIGIYGQSDYVQTQSVQNLSTLLDQMIKQPASINNWKAQLLSQWNQIQSQRSQETLTASKKLIDGPMQVGTLPQNNSCHQNANLSLSLDHLSYIACQNFTTPWLHQNFKIGLVNKEVFSQKKTPLQKNNKTKPVNLDMLEQSWKNQLAYDLFTAGECVRRNVKDSDSNKLVLFCNSSHRFLSEFQKSLVVIQAENSESFITLKVELDGFDAANTAQIFQKVSQDFQGEL